MKRRHARFRRRSRSRKRSRTLVRRRRSRGGSFRGLPRKMPISMRYAETVNLTSNAGLNGTYVICANSLFDPNASGIGHQPRLYDQLVGTFFDHYVVVGLKLRVMFSHAETAPVMLGITPRDTNTIDTDNDNSREYPGTKYIMSQATGGSASRTLVYNFNPNKFLGRSNPLSDPELKGSVGSSPSEKAYLHMWMFRPDGSAITTGVLSYQIDFSSVLIEPKIGTPS